MTSTSEQDTRSKLEMIAYLVLKAHNLDQWSDRAVGMLKACHEQLECQASILYVLHLDTGELRPDFTFGDTGAFEKNLDLNSREASSFLPLKAATTRSVLEEHGNVAIPILRKQTPLFVVFLRRPTIRPDWILLSELLAPLRPAYVARRVTRLLSKASQERLDYQASWTSFMRHLGDVILQSTGFQFAALRELRKDRLDCLDVWGFKPQPDLRSLSWPRSKYEPFDLAAEGLSTSVRNLIESPYRELATVNGLEVIRGFVVVPVFAGLQPFGTLSVATSVPYDIAPAEQTALENFGNMVGLVIAHYRNPRGPSPSLSLLTDFSMRTSLEVIAASARHEGLIHIDNGIEVVGKLADAKTKEDRDAAIEELQGILLDTGIVIDKIRSAANPPEYVWEQKSIKRIWKDAKDQFSGRLDSLNIEVSDPQRDAVVGCYPDWLRSVFLQLILNSIDAFNKKGFGLKPPPKEHRELGLTIDPVKPDQPMVEMRYWDNATGINENKLQSRAEDDNLPLARRIFRPGSSTKGSEGSGWGLALARTALAEHQGSIELADNSIHGVTFRILLPNRD